MSSPPRAALAVRPGQFQVFRHDDLVRLEEALRAADRVLVILGSAHKPRSPRHPFSWEERAEVIRECLPVADRARVAFEPMREWYDEERTSRDMARIVEAHGHSDGAQVLASGLEPDEGEAALRELLFSAEDPQVALAQIAPQLPVPVRHFLAAWTHRPEHQLLREEWNQYAHEKAQWSVAPYPVVLVTVDAVVRSGDQVLLIRRGRLPGKGLQALPGGFLDPAETVYEGAVRELVEETRIGLSAREARKLLRGVRVFDHPQRSQRGRVITHAHYFDLEDMPLPKVSGGDDAAAAQWVAISQLGSLEAEFMDDHFLILDHFLGLVDS